MKLSCKKEDIAHSRIDTYFINATNTYKASLQVSHKTKIKPKINIKVFKMT